MANSTGDALIRNSLALGGAAVGGVVGYFACQWILRYGFYALILPGGLLGLGASVVRNRSILVAVACGLAATALGFYTEFRISPWIVDSSLAYFVRNLHNLSPVTLGMVAVGGIIGFWVPFRHRLSARFPSELDNPAEPDQR